MKKIALSLMLIVSPALVACETNSSEPVVAPVEPGPIDADAAECPRRDGEPCR